MKEVTEKEMPAGKKHGIIVALIPIVAMMFLLIVGYGMYHIEPQVLLISGLPEALVFHKQDFQQNSKEHLTSLSFWFMV